MNLTFLPFTFAPVRLLTFHSCLFSMPPFEGVIVALFMVIGGFMAASTQK